MKPKLIISALIASSISGMKMPAFAADKKSLTMTGYLKLGILILTVLFVSCNRHEEPPLEVNLQIIEQYLPATTVFDRDDTEFRDRVAALSDKSFAVNSLAELTDDPFGFSDAYYGIDFDNYTLLITYWLHNIEIDTYRNRYYRNTQEDSYNWTIHIGTSTPPDSSTDKLQFTRFAILVRKLPENADLRIWKSLSAINWGWE